MSAGELKVSSFEFLEWNPGHQCLPGSDVDFFYGVSPFTTQLEHKPWRQQRLLNDSVPLGILVSSVTSILSVIVVILLSSPPQDKVQLLGIPGLSGKHSVS